MLSQLFQSIYFGTFDKENGAIVKQLKCDVIPCWFSFDRTGSIPVFSGCFCNTTTVEEVNMLLKSVRTIEKAHLEIETHQPKKKKATTLQL